MQRDQSIGNARAWSPTIDRPRPGWQPFSMIALFKDRVSFGLLGSDYSVRITLFGDTLFGDTLFGDTVFGDTVYWAKGVLTHRQSMLRQKTGDSVFQHIASPTPIANLAACSSEAIVLLFSYVACEIARDEWTINEIGVPQSE
jgi:hypothetical protein